MIIFGHGRVCCAFLRLHSEYAEIPEACQTIGKLDRRGSLVGATAIHHFNGVNVLADIALAPGAWARDLISTTLRYVFIQLKAERLTFMVAANNLKSIALVERLGAIHEATLQSSSRQGDERIYVLRKGNCPTWSKVNG